MRAARTTADQEDALETSEAVDFTSLLAGALLGHGPAAVEEATMIKAAKAAKIAAIENDTNVSAVVQISLKDGWQTGKRTNSF